MKTRAELEQENTKIQDELAQVRAQLLSKESHHHEVVTSKDTLIDQLKEALILAQRRQFAKATETLRSLQSELFDESYYTTLGGGILESFGRLFKNDLKLYIYPLKDRINGGSLTTTENLAIPEDLRQLYGYLIGRGCIEDLETFREDCLDIFSRDVLRKIEEGDDSWKSSVPESVAQVITARRYYSPG